MKDHLTIQKQAISEIVINKSVFIAQINPIINEEDAQNILESIKKNHYKATHHCYAYILGEEKNILKCADDGEPSGTAGKPILSILQHHDLTDILLVVTRYFGGIKLGAAGLVRAYGQSASNVLDNAQIIKRQVCNIVSFKFDYNFLGKMQAYLSADNYLVKDSIFSDEVLLSIYAPVDLSGKIIADVYDLSSGVCKGIVTDQVYRDVIIKEEINA